MLIEFYSLGSSIPTNVFTSSSRLISAPNISGKYHSLCANNPWQRDWCSRNAFDKHQSSQKFKSGVVCVLCSSIHSE